MKAFNLTSMLSDQAKAYLSNRLENELPAHLTYHNLVYVPDVYDTAARLATAEGVQWKVLEKFTGVTLIAGQSEAIKEKRVKDFGRGITVYKGKRGYLPGSYEQR